MKDFRIGYYLHGMSLDGSRAGHDRYYVRYGGEV